MLNTAVDVIYDVRAKFENQILNGHGIALGRDSSTIIWTGKNEYGRVEIWVEGWWMGKKTKEQKN